MTTSNRHFFTYWKLYVAALFVILVMIELSWTSQDHSEDNNTVKVPDSTTAPLTRRSEDNDLISTPFIDKATTAEDSSQRARGQKLLKDFKKVTVNWKALNNRIKNNFPVHETLYLTQVINHYGTQTYPPYQEVCISISVDNLHFNQVLNLRNSLKRIQEACNQDEIVEEPVEAELLSGDQIPSPAIKFKPLKTANQVYTAQSKDVATELRLIDKTLSDFINAKRVPVKIRFRSASPTFGRVTTYKYLLNTEDGTFENQILKFQEPDAILGYGSSRRLSRGKDKFIGNGPTPRRHEKIEQNHRNGYNRFIDVFEFDSEKQCKEHLASLKVIRRNEVKIVTPKTKYTYIFHTKEIFSKRNGSLKCHSPSGQLRVHKDIQNGLYQGTSEYYAEDGTLLYEEVAGEEGYLRVQRYFDTKGILRVKSMWTKKGKIKHVYNEEGVLHLSLDYTRRGEIHYKYHKP